MTVVIPVGHSGFVGFYSDTVILVSLFMHSKGEKKCVSEK